MADNVQILTREQALSGEHVELPAPVLRHLQRLPEGAILVRHDVAEVTGAPITERPEGER